VHCDHCRNTVGEGARFCPFCGGKLTGTPAAEAIDPSQAPTVALTVGPCESCGAPSLPGSTLCLPCTRAFESILGTQPAAPADGAADAATLLQPRAPVPPSAPEGAAPPQPATIVAPPGARGDVPPADDPLGDDEEYEDEADDLLAEEAATVLVVAAAPPPRPEPAAPPAPPEPAFAADSMDWSTPPAASNDHEGIVALPPWARKGPDAETESPAEAAPEAPGAEPVPWWERNGQQSPTAAAKPEVARYVPPSAAAPPASASLESTLARQAMRPKSPAAVAAAIPAPRASGDSRRRSLIIGAALAGVAAIGTPVMWKLAFASRPTTVSALPIEPAAAPQPAPPRAERVHGTPAAAPPAPRVYHDLQPPAPPPAAPAAPAASAPTGSQATPKSAPKKPAVTAAAVPVAAPVAAPEPAPLLVTTPPPVVAAPAAAAAPPPSVQAEAVPLGQIFEVSQVEARPSVTNRFDPVLPARLRGHGTTPMVVIVRVLVSPSGRAVESSPVKNPSNDAGLGAAAAATVRQWTFAPARKKGQAVSCWVNVGVVFKSASGD
jgi:TonB family protein